MAHRYWYCQDWEGDWNANDGSQLDNWYTDSEHTQHLAGTSYSPAAADVLHFDGGIPHGDWNGHSWPDSLTIAGVEANDIDCHNGSIEAWGFTTGWTVTNSLVNSSNFIFRGNCSGASTVTGLVAGPGANVGNSRTFTLCPSESGGGTITCGNNCTITGWRQMGVQPQFALSAGTGLQITGDGLDLGDNCGECGTWQIGNGASISAHVKIGGKIELGVTASVAGGIEARLRMDCGIGLADGSVVDGGLSAEGPVSIGSGCTVSAGVCLTAGGQEYGGGPGGGVSVGDSCTFLGDMNLVVDRNDGGITVGSGWKVRNGVSGGSLTLDAENGTGYQTDVTLGSPSGGQSRAFQSVTVKGKDNRTTDISSLGDISVTGSFSVSLSGNWGGGAYLGPGTVTLAKKGATASAPGLSVVENIPVGHAGGGVVNIG